MLWPAPTNQSLSIERRCSKQLNRLSVPAKAAPVDWRRENIALQATNPKEPS